MMNDRKYLRSFFAAGLAACILLVTASGAVFSGSSMTAFGQETEAETESLFSGDTAAAIFEGLDLPPGVRDVLGGLSDEEIAEYVVIIEKLLMNPDFRSLFAYEEIRDLVVTLIHNALDFATNEPDLTKQILKTMGVDSKVIFIFYGLLRTRQENKDGFTKLRKFLTSDEGNALIDLFLEQLSEENISALLEDYAKKLEVLMQLYGGQG